MLNFQKIENEEYFYYTITNILLNNLKDPLINIEFYHESLKKFYHILTKFTRKKRIL